MQTGIKEQPQNDVLTIGNTIIRYRMKEGRRLFYLALLRLKRNWKNKKEN